MMSLVSFGILVGWITVGILAATMLAFGAYIIWQGFRDRSDRLKELRPKDELPPLPTRIPGQHRPWSDVKDDRSTPPHDPAP